MLSLYINDYFILDLDSSLMVVVVRFRDGIVYFPPPRIGHKLLSKPTLVKELLVFPGFHGVCLVDCEQAAFSAVSSAPCNRVIVIVSHITHIDI